MRHKKTAGYLCTGLLLFSITGCGHSDVNEDIITIVNTNDFDDVTDTSDAETNNNDVSQHPENTQLQPDITPSQQTDIIQSQSDATPPQQTDTMQSQLDCELDGSIESIGENSVVINQTFHPSENESVSYIGSAETLVTVYFSEETEFEVWTVKNGGVNGDADIEKQQGTFSDLKLDVGLNMTGWYEGNDFYAEKVIIYNFV
ncbi:MAG: hypothetical protein NC231_13400 [Bacillus sp. (in: Bacteria)]|nr:hypothetical protein [Bacillus sp. (in: firmicutes)]MCM1425015.1 hypothetical protein [Eubacterium sp.]